MPYIKYLQRFLHVSLFSRNKKLLLELSKKSYPVCRIFITFEKQKHKEYCLDQLKLSQVDAMFTNSTRDSYRRFNGVQLNVQQPAEPDVILWKNLKVCR